MAKTLNIFETISALETKGAVSRDNGNLYREAARHLRESLVYYTDLHCSHCAHQPSGIGGCREDESGPCHACHKDACPCKDCHDASAWVWDGKPFEI